MQLGATKQQLQGRQKTFFLEFRRDGGVFVDKLAQRFGTQLGAVLLWRRDPFWRLDACSLEPPNNRQAGRKRNLSRNSRRDVRIVLCISFERNSVLLCCGEESVLEA